MCRWMAYSGDPVLAEELLFRPAHSIIDQSLHAQLGEYTTNGDGFGIGWYGDLFTLLISSLPIHPLTQNFSTLNLLSTPITIPPFSS